MDAGRLLASNNAGLVLPINLNFDVSPLDQGIGNYLAAHQAYQQQQLLLQQQQAQAAQEAAMRAQQSQPQATPQAAILQQSQRPPGHPSGGAGFGGSQILGYQPEKDDNHIYAGLIEHLISSQSQENALYGRQAQMDYLQQNKFEQQEKMAYLRNGLKTGVIRYTPDQKTQQAQLVKSMNSVDTDPRFSPDQRSQARSSLQQQYDSIQPTPVPLDEQPPTPQEMFDKEAPRLTDDNGYSYRVAHDRSGRPVEFISEAEKEDIKQKAAAKARIEEAAAKAHDDHIKAQAAREEKESVERQRVSSEAMDKLITIDPITGAKSIPDQYSVDRYIKTHMAAQERIKNGGALSPDEQERAAMEDAAQSPQAPQQGLPAAPPLYPVQPPMATPEQSAWNPDGPTDQVGAPPGLGVPGAQQYMNQYADAATRMIDPGYQQWKQEGQQTPPRQGPPLPPQAPQSNEPVHVSSPEEVKKLKLPPGTRIIGPDGRTGTVN